MNQKSICLAGKSLCLPELSAFKFAVVIFVLSFILFPAAIKASGSLFYDSGPGNETALTSSVATKKVSGKVVFGSRNKPAQGAVIRVRETGLTRRTDAHGYFEIILNDSLCNRAVILEAELSGTGKAAIEIPATQQSVSAWMQLEKTEHPEVKKAVVFAGEVTESGSGQWKSRYAGVKIVIAETRQCIYTDEKGRFYLILPAAFHLKNLHVKVKAPGHPWLIQEVFLGPKAEKMEFNFKVTPNYFYWD